MMWWWGDSWGHWIGFGFSTLFWIAVIVGIVYLIRYAASRSHAANQQPPTSGEAQSPSDQASAEGAGGAGSEALRILEERYARGEIDRDEFLQRKADLTS